MASCWICLDDGADQYGKSPVSDCSCDYARRKSIEVDDRSQTHPNDFILSWSICEHCKQLYEKQLRVDLLFECKQFVDEQYPECGWRHLAVQNVMLLAVLIGAQQSKEKREGIIETTLSMIDQLSMQSDSRIHPLLIMDLKAESFNAIGQIQLDLEDFTEVEAKKSLQYLETSIKIKKIVGDEADVARTEVTIASYKAKCIEKLGAHEAFGRPETNEEFLERQRNVYRVMLDAGGEVQSINQGSDLAIALIETHRTLKRGGY